MEMSMLVALEFDVTVPSAYRFLERYFKLCNHAQDQQLFFLAQYLMEISLLDASLLQFKPSEIAAASIILSAKCLKKPGTFWHKQME